MKFFLFRPNSEVFTALKPVGLLSLAAYLQEYGRHQIKIYGGRLFCSNTAEILEQISAYQPDVIGISLLSMERQIGHLTIKKIKQAFPKIPIVAGGPYPTSDVNDIMENPYLDFAVTGEGELVANELLSAMEKEGDFTQIKGIAYRKDGTKTINERADFIQDLDKLPLPAWDLINVADYHTGKTRFTQMNNWGKFLESAPMFTSRGCPYHCYYCHNLFGRKVRYRSIPLVIDELKLLKEQYGIREVEFMDDAFNVDVNRAKNLFRAIIDAKLELSFCFPNGLRADVVDEELVDLMKEGGTYRVLYAIESGSPRIQKEMKKHLNLDKAKKIIEYTAKKRISVGIFNLLGFLNETEEDMWMTINFAVKSKAHTAAFYILNPFPNTEVHRLAKQQGFPMDDVNFVQYFSMSVNITKVPAERVLKLQKYAYRRFFLNPVRIYRMLRTTPSYNFFFIKVLAAVYLFFSSAQMGKKKQIGTSATEGVHKLNWLTRMIYKNTGMKQLEAEVEGL